MNKHIVRDIQFTRWLFRAYLVLLFLIPLPLGSNRPFFWSLMVAAVALLALVWGVGWFVGVARWPQAMRRARWALISSAEANLVRDLSRFAYKVRFHGL